MARRRRKKSQTPLSFLSFVKGYTQIYSSKIYRSLLYYFYLPPPSVLNSNDVHPYVKSESSRDLPFLHSTSYYNPIPCHFHFSNQTRQPPGARRCPAKRTRRRERKREFERACESRPGSTSLANAESECGREFDVGVERFYASPPGRRWGGGFMPSRGVRSGLSPLCFLCPFFLPAVLVFVPWFLLISGGRCRVQ